MTCRDHAQHGTTLRFDKDALANPQTTLFRGVELDFRPSDLLMEGIVGTRPFEGTSWRFGEPNWLHGVLESTIHTLVKEGEARWVARPHLLLTEGAPASLEITSDVPRLLLTSASRTTTNFTSVGESTGLRVRATARRVSDDGAVLDLDLWLRVPFAVEDANAPVATFALRERHVTTRVHCADRKPRVIGGLTIRGARAGSAQPACRPRPRWIPSLGGSVTTGRNARSGLWPLWASALSTPAQEGAPTMRRGGGTRACGACSDAGRMRGHKRRRPVADGHTRSPSHPTHHSCIYR